MLTRRRFAGLVAASALSNGAFTRSAAAEQWPARHVRIIVPFVRGGATDVIARVMGNRLSQAWGQQVVVENRGGGGAHVGAQGAAQSDPDGYTLYIPSVPHATNRASLPQVKNGAVRGLAVTAAKRVAAATELPTIAEAGVPGFDVSTWFALFVPAKTPHDLIGRINADAIATLGHPMVKERLEQFGATLVGSTPQELAAFLKAEMDKWGPVIREAKIKVDE